MGSFGSRRFSSPLARVARGALIVALGGALAAAAPPASAQSITRGEGQNGGGKHRGGGGGGGGGVAAGVAGVLIGIGAGLLIEHARARAAREEVVEEDEVERPRRRAERPQTERPKADRPKSERPKVVRAVSETPDLRAGSKRKAEPRRPDPKLARQTPAKDPQARDAPSRRDANRSRPPAPPSNAAPLAPAAAVAAAPAADRSIVPDEVLFEVRAGTSDRGVDALAGRQGLERLSAERFDLTGSTVYRYRITDGRPVPEVVAALSADPMVKTVQPNHIFALSEGAVGALAATQYAVAKMRLEEAHRTATGATVTIAVIDSGVDAKHAALKSAVIESFDPVGGEFRPHAHGTAVAALAAGRGALASPAPGARILAIRAFAPDQPAKPGAQGTTLHIVRGLDFAAKRGAKVINMSFAGPRDAKIAEFVAAGAAKGAIHVAAAGNAGPSSPPLYPAAEPGVIAVTATGADDQLLPVANRGAHLAVAAPGVDVLVASPGGGYTYMSGTSMASAEIAGLVALLVETKPLLTAQEARTAIESSARDLGPAGPDADFGAGAADARGALDTIGAPPTGPMAAGPAAGGQSAVAAGLAERP